VKRNIKLPNKVRHQLKWNLTLLTGEENNQEKLLMKHMILKFKTFAGLISIDSRYRGKVVND
jgi:hypothetical protein